MEVALPSNIPSGILARTWGAAGERIDQIRINHLEMVTHDGRQVWRKTRTRASRWLIPVANTFFRLAGNPVEVLPTGADWRERELLLFRLLNGVGRDSGSDSERAVYAENLPGEDLVRLLETGRLPPGVLAEVGAAFRSLHGLVDPQTGEFFSHGDPHLGNVLYDAEAMEGGRVHWIDFETRHRAGLPVEDRRADDLLVFLLDLLGRTPALAWDGQAAAFLAGYADEAVLLRLVGRLHPPRGWARLWWGIRTSYVPRRELCRRLDVLNGVLGGLILF